MAVRTTVAGLAVAVALVATACADDDPAADPPASSGAASTSEPSTPEASEPTEPAEPSVTPAAGLLLKEETSQIHVPEGPWARLDDIVTYASSVGRSDTAETIQLSDNVNLALPSPLEDQVENHNGGLPPGSRVERLPDVLLDGVPAYVVRWSTRRESVDTYDVGTQRDGRVVVLHFSLLKDDRTAAEAVVASSLATFAWR